MRQITARFPVTGQGVIIQVEGLTNEPVSRAVAKIARPDGSILQVIADRMLLQRHDGLAPESDVFMLAHVDVSDAPEGSMFEIVALAEIVRGKPLASK